MARALLVTGVVLIVAAILRLLVNDAAGIAALTLWSLLYIWPALLLRRAAATQGSQVSPVV